MESCERWVEAVSAAADGEATDVDAAALRAHLASCPSCRAFAGELDQLSGRVHLAPDVEPTGLPRRVVQLNAVAERSSTRLAARTALAVMAAAIAVQAFPALVLGHDGNGTSHDARHLGAFSLAYGIGLAVVAFRPARARTILPVAAVIAAALAITAVIDAIEGHVPLLSEADHLPELISVGLVWLLARQVSSARSAGDGPAPPSPTAAGTALRLVQDAAPGDGRARR